MYCGERCKMAAHDQYHRTECKILPFLGKYSVGDKARFILLPLRMFLIGSEQGSALSRLMDDPRILKALDGKLDGAGAGVLNQPDDYLALLASPWKHSEGSTHNTDLVLRVRLETIITLLEKIDFFKQDREAYEVRNDTRRSGRR